MAMAWLRLGVAASLLFGVMAGCESSSQARFARTDHLSVPHMAMSALDVATANGAISVEQGPGDVVSIEATIRATTQERLDGTRVVALREPDETLRVRVEWADGIRLGSEGCSLSITMPDAGQIDLESKNGRLAVEGVGTDVRLSTSNGRVHVADIGGAVHARTSNGRITLARIPGAVDVATSNGRLEFVDVAGPIRGHSSNGGVQVRLAVDNRGPLDITTSNGSVSIEVGEQFDGLLRVETSNGRLNVAGLQGAALTELGKNTATLRFGDDASIVSRVHTKNGSITLTQRGSE